MIPLKMPKLGSTMDEGTIVAWKVMPGDIVGAGDVLYEVTTDKVNMEVEAEKSLKVIKLLAQTGATVAVGANVALIETDEPVLDLSLTQSEEVRLADSPSPQPVHKEMLRGAQTFEESPQAVRASPAARHLARKLGVDLQTLAGSGPRGRVTPMDVQNYHRNHANEPLQSPAESPPIREPQPFMGPRAIVAHRMTQSAQIPQVTLTMSADMTSVLSLRTQWKERGSAVSVVDMVLLATARMLGEVPSLNGWVEGAQFVAAPGVDLGYAVDVPHKGLYVVTVQEAHALRLEQIAQQRRLRTDRALKGTATLQDLGKPSFTISNLGPMGVETFNPLLMPPQVGILGLGAIYGSHESPRMSLCLTFDHRVIDGAPAALALKRIKQFLEMPTLLL